MSPAHSYAANAYHSVGVESLANSGNPHQLVVMLFNGARAAIAVARGHLQRKEVEAKGAAISKAIAIIDGGLKASLDLKVGGEMAQNLADLYDYMGRRLFQANLKNDAKALDEVAQLLQQLGGAWESIGAKAAPTTVAREPAARPALAQVPAPVAAVPTVRSAPTPAPSPIAAAAPPQNSPAPAVLMQSRRLASAYGAF
jgi:flagellar protein FliS